jgi:uncharacterized membrane protein
MKIEAYEPFEKLILATILYRVTSQKAIMLRNTFISVHVVDIEIHLISVFREFSAVFTI